MRGMPCTALRTALVPAGEHRGQHGCTRSVDVLGRRQQDQPLAGGDGSQPGDRVGRRRLRELTTVAAGELGEALGNVSVPAPQLGTGRHVLGPLVMVHRLLGQPARPQTVNQDTVLTPAAARVVIDPHDLDVRLSHGLPPPAWSPVRLQGSRPPYPPATMPGPGHPGASCNGAGPPPTRSWPPLGAHPRRKPSAPAASSFIMAGLHGGSHTTRTSTPTAGPTACATASFAMSGRLSAAGHPGVVSVISTTTTPCSSRTS